MDLDKTFLTALGNEQSAEAVLRATDVCGRELRAAYGFSEGGDEIDRIFFPDGGETGSTDRAGALADMIRLAVQYERYDWLLNEAQREDSWLLGLMQEVLGLYAAHRRDWFLEHAAKGEIRSYEQLYEAARRIRNSKRIVFWVRQGEEKVLKHTLPFTENWKERGSFGCDMVQSLLISALRKSWKIAVLAGNKGLTPQRWYALVRDGKQWRSLQVD